MICSHWPVWWSLGRCCARTPGSRWQSVSSAASQCVRPFPGPPERWSPPLLVPKAKAELLHCPLKRHAQLNLSFQGRYVEQWFPIYLFFIWCPVTWTQIPISSTPVMFQNVFIWTDHQRNHINLHIVIVFFIHTVGTDSLVGLSKYILQPHLWMPF